VQSAKRRYEKKAAHSLHRLYRSLIRPRLPQHDLNLNPNTLCPIAYSRVMIVASITSPASWPLFLLSSRFYYPPRAHLLSVRLPRSPSPQMIKGPTRPPDWTDHPGLDRVELRPARCIQQPERTRCCVQPAYLQTRQDRISSIIGHPTSFDGGRTFLVFSTSWA
jgi:hypothetical protein